MIITIDTDSDEAGGGEQTESLETTRLAEMGFTESKDLQEWVIEKPAILGEELLILTSEYAGFQDTSDRLDILALDTDGRLVVVELKRDRADQTTDLQAIKYASYCATLTAKEVQQEYRSFWSEQNGGGITPEDVSQKFAEFLTQFVDDPPITDEGWVDFDLSERPRILLAAGSFGTEITSPVLWLSNEYELDISCIKIETYDNGGQVVVSSQQIIPIPEAEEYMTKRREKREEQQKSSSGARTIELLLERNVLSEGDTVYFNRDKLPDDPDSELLNSDSFWWANITGKQGQSNNIEWEWEEGQEDETEYSFTGLTKEILYRLNDRDKSKSLNGYNYWKHPDADDRTLKQLRDNETTGSEITAESE